MRISDGVQTCALPIFIERLQRLAGGRVLQLFNHLHLDAGRFLQDRQRVARRAAIGIVIDGRLHAPGSLIGLYPWPATPPAILSYSRRRGITALHASPVAAEWWSLPRRSHIYRKSLVQRK